MNTKKDVRGFSTFDEFKCCYGTNIRVKESSAASEPCIWLFLEEDPTILTTPVPGNAGAHLDIAGATRLIQALSTAIAEHYQVK